MNTKKTFSEKWIDMIAGFDRAAFATALGLGSWIAPGAPAIVYGGIFYFGMSEKFDNIFAIFGATLAAFGLIIAGAIASHNAVKAGGWWWVVPFVVNSFEISGLWYFDTDNNTKVLGIVISLLTLTIYVGRAAAVDIQHNETLEIEDHKAKLIYEHEMELKKLELQHQKELAKIEANKEARIAKAEAQKVYTKTVYEDTQLDTQNDRDTRLKEAVVNTLVNNEKINITQLSKQFGYTRKTIYKRLDELQELGLIHKNGNGWELNGEQS